MWAAYLQEKEEHRDDADEPVLGVPGHVDDVVKDRAPEEERELHAPNRGIVREERVLEACANSPGRATRTALRDCMASWLSCASMPKRKMGRL